MQATVKQELIVRLVFSFPLRRNKLSTLDRVSMPLSRGTVCENEVDEKNPKETAGGEWKITEEEREREGRGEEELPGEKADRRRENRKSRHERPIRNVYRRGGKLNPLKDFFYQCR